MTATDPVQAVAQAIHEHDANASMSGAPWPTWDELSDDGRAAYGYVAEAAVAAARLFIAAEVLREAADSLEEVDAANDAVYWDGQFYVSVTDWLRERADDLEAGR